MTWDQFLHNQPERAPSAPLCPSCGHPGTYAQHTIDGTVETLCLNCGSTL